MPPFSRQFDKMLSIGVGLHFAKPNMSGVKGAFGELEGLQKKNAAAQKRQILEQKKLSDQQVRQAEKAAAAQNTIADRSAREQIAVQERINRMEYQIAATKKRIAEATADFQIAQQQKRERAALMSQRRIERGEVSLAETQRRLAIEQARMPGIGARGAAATGAAGMYAGQAAAAAGRSSSLDARLQSAANRATFAHYVTRPAMGGLKYGAIGLGAVGVGSVIEAARWQSYVSQQQTMSQIGAGRMAGVANQALGRYGVGMGANPRDIIASYRIASDYNLTARQQNQLVRTSAQFALPAGMQVQTAAQVLGAVKKTTPGINIHNIGEMVMMGARVGRTTPEDYTVNLSRLMNMLAIYAERYNNPTIVPQGLALFSQLTERGVKASYAATFAYQFIKQSVMPTPKGLKEAVRFDKQFGTNIAAAMTPGTMGTMGPMGIIGALHRANVSPGEIQKLYPEIRGAQGAFGVVGGPSEYANFLQLYGKIRNAPNTRPLETSMARYANLPTTKFKELENSLLRTTILLGTKMTPAVVQFEKMLIPIAGTVSDVAVKLNNIGPGLTGLAVGLGSVWVAIKAIQGIRGMAGIIRGVNTALKAESLTELLLGTRTKATTVSLGVEAGAETAVGAGATGAVGSAAAGTGLAGLGARLGRIIGPGIAVAIAAAITGELVGAMAWLQGKLGFGNPSAITKNDPLLGLMSKLGIPFPTSGNKTGGGTQSRGGPWAAAPRGWSPPTGGFIGVNTGPISYAQMHQPTAYSKNLAWEWSGGKSGHWAKFPGTTTAAAFHYDVPGNNMPFKLPGGTGTSYKVIGLVHNPKGATQPGWWVTWQGPDGAVFTTGELNEIPGPKQLHSNRGLHIGSVLHGGEYAGRGSNHIHIAGNQAAVNLIYGTSGGGPAARAGHHRVMASGLGLNVLSGKTPAAIRRQHRAIGAAAQAHHIPAGILAGIIEHESRGVVGARNPSSGAAGLMQILPSNFVSLGLTSKTAFQAAPNVMAGALLLQRDLHAAHGNMHLALAYYAVGQGNYTSNANIPGAGPARKVGNAFANYVMGHAKTYAGRSTAGPGNETKTPGTGPQSLWALSALWSTKAGSVQSYIQQLYGANPDPWKMHPSSRTGYRKLLEKQYWDQHMSNVALIKAEYKDPTLRASQLALEHRSYEREKSHPFKFAAHGKYSGLAGTVDPIHMIGQRDCREQAKQTAESKKITHHTATSARHLGKIVKNTGVVANAVMRGGVGGVGGVRPNGYPTSGALPIVAPPGY